MVIVAAGGQRVGLPAQPAELVQVDRLGIDIEHVAARAPRQPNAVADGLPQQRPQPRDIDREAFPCLGRRLGVPQPVDESLSGHDCSRREQEDREDTPRPGRSKVTLPAGRPELYRPERPEFMIAMHFYRPWAGSQLYILRVDTPLRTIPT